MRYKNRGKIRYDYFFFGPREMLPIFLTTGHYGTNRIQKGSRAAKQILETYNFKWKMRRKIKNKWKEERMK